MTCFESDRETLVNSLRASKGWMKGYAEAFVDTFGDACARRTTNATDNKFEERIASRELFDRYPYLTK